MIDPALVDLGLFLAICTFLAGLGFLFMCAGIYLLACLYEWATSNGDTTL